MAPLGHHKRLLWSSFLQKQVLTGFLQNNCSKQRLKLPATHHRCFFHKKLGKAKIKTSQDKFFCNADADAEVNVDAHAEMPMLRFPNRQIGKSFFWDHGHRSWCKWPLSQERCQSDNKTFVFVFLHSIWHEASSYTPSHRR